MLINIFMPTIYADDEEEEELNEIELQEIVESATKPNNEPVLNSKSAIIYDRTTKIMTAIVVLENSKLTDTVTISKKAANTGGSRLKLNTGDKITVNDLLYGLMLRSRK